MAIGTNIKTFTINYHKTSSSSISDLTGTKWIINDSPTVPSACTIYDLNFTSNNTNYIDIIIGGTNGSIRYTISNHSDATVYESGWEPPFEAGWTNDAYKTITIIGGTDATNSDLITWLQANATQIIESQPFSVVKFNNLTLGRINNHYLRSLNGISVRSGKSSSVSLITFTIDGTTYQAEDGMTWAEWCDSEYNTAGCYVSDGFVHYYYNSVYDNDGQNFSPVSPTASIKSNVRYYQSGGSND